MSAWPRAPLADLLVDATPGFACGDDVEDGVFQFRMNNISIDGQIDFRRQRRVPRAARRLDRFLVEPGDVLFNATNSPDLVGKTAFFSGWPEPVVFSNHLLRLRPRTRILDGNFLFRWLHLQFQRGQFKAKCRQWVNQATVNRDSLLAMQCPVPPLREQRRIAEILDKADALRAKRRAAIAQLDTLTQSIFLDMFGDPAGHGWAMSTIDGVVAEGASAVRTGPFGSQLLHSEFTDEGIAVLGIDNAVENEFRWVQRRFITEEKFRRLSRYAVHPGDVLITIMGTCGRCAIVPDDIPVSINTKHLCCITLDRTACLPVFFHAYFLRHPIARSYLARKAKGAIMAGLNMGIIRDMPIPLAPIELQREFKAVVEVIGSAEAAQRNGREEFDSLFASLQHRAFRGEI